MPSDHKSLVLAAGLVVVMLMLAGCMSRSTVPVAEQQAAREERAVTEQPQTRREPDAPELAEERAEETPEEEPDVIAVLLAERRRGDFPAVEFQDAGFTITEQLRISGDARADYEAASSLLRQQRFAEGVELLLAVTGDSPGLTAPYIDLAIAYGHLGETEKAEEALETAKALSPENPVVHNELGILYRKAGRFSEARQSYETALSIFEDFHFARRNLAVLCDLYLGDLDCALQNYLSYLDSVNGDPEVEIWVADLENRLGQ